MVGATSSDDFSVHFCQEQGQNEGNSRIVMLPKSTGANGDFGHFQLRAQLDDCLHLTDFLLMVYSDLRSS